MGLRRDAGLAWEEGRVRKSTHFGWVKWALLVAGILSLLVECSITKSSLKALARSFALLRDRGTRIALMHIAYAYVALVWLTWLLRDAPGRTGWVTYH